MVRRQEYETAELYERDGKYWYLGGVNWLGLFCWAAGVIVYHLVNPILLSNVIEKLDVSPTLLSTYAQVQGIVPDALTGFGGSLPSFIVAFVLYAVLSPVLLRRNDEEE